MSGKQNNTLRLALTKARAELGAVADDFVTLFERGDARVLLFAPDGTDTQTPHSQDEIYIVTRGSGIFRRSEESVEFVAGDLLFVAARVPHRFESFTADFETWVVFFGPRH